MCNLNRRKDSKSSKYKIVSILLILFIIFSTVIPVLGEQPKADDMPEGTLIIGTYIIPLEALDKEIYTVAVQSGKDAPQTKVYYKSEFAKGTWFDITDSSVFGAIFPEKGKMVKSSVIDGIKLTHLVKTTGEIIDLIKNVEVGINDIDKTMNKTPEAFSEIESLTIEKRIIEKQPDSDEKSIKLKSIERILKPFSGDGYVTIQKKVDSMSSYILHVKKDIPKLKDKYLDILLPMKEQLKIRKDLEAYKELKKRIEDEIKLITELGYSDFLTKLNDASAGIEKKSTETANQLETESSELFESEKWKLKNELYASIDKDNQKAADTTLEKIALLIDLLKDNVTDKKKALALLDVLKAEVMKKYIEKLKIADSDKYLDAKKNGESDAVLSGIKKDETSEIKNIKGDLDRLNVMLIKLLGSAGKEKELLKKELTSLIKALVQVLKGKQDSKITVISDHINELSKKLGQLDGGGGTNKISEQIAGIEKKIGELKEKYMDSLEKNKLGDAEKIASEIQALNDKKDGLTSGAANSIKKLVQDKEILDKNIDKAIAAGDMEKISKLKKQKDESSQEAESMKVLLPDNVKQLLEIHEANKSELLGSIKDKDIDAANSVLDDMEAISEIFPANLKEMLEDEATLKKAGQLINEQITDSTAIGDSENVDKLLKLMDRIKKILGKGAGESSDKSKAEILVKLEALEKVTDINGKNARNIKSEINQLEIKKEQLTDNVFNIIAAGESAAAKEIIPDLKETEAKLKNSKRQLLFIDLGLSDKIEVKKDDKRMLTALNSLKSDILTQLKAMEKEKYSERELGELDKKAKEIKLEDDSLVVASADSVIFEEPSFKLDSPPVLGENDYIVGLRAVYEMLGAAVEWYGSERKAVITKDDKIITVFVGEKDVDINGRKYNLKTATYLKANRIYISMEFIASSLGYEYKWYGEQKTAVVIN